MQVENELTIPLVDLLIAQETEGAVGKITGLPAGVVPLEELVNPAELPLKSISAENKQ